MYADDPQRALIQKVFVRICKDSGFGFDLVQATNFTAQLLNIHGLEVVGAVGFSNMEQIASGEHLICKTEGEIT